MRLYTEAELIDFENACCCGLYGNKCKCGPLQRVVEHLTGYIRATVGVAPAPPFPRTDYDGWEERYAAYWGARRAGGAA